ncbi:MAG: HEAT repeat domain-containing protein [Phycisphaeraceae bacterium]|nr:HEAT repeat domain-containing protein [Phycisphaeraceae bacterium]
MNVTCITIVAAVGLMSLPALAQEAIGFDPETGRNARHYPPSCPADFIHMKLDLTIPDMNVPRIEAVETLTLSARAEPIASLKLDARLLQIASVSSPGRRTSYTHDGRTLMIAFEPPLNADERADVTIEYTVEDPPDGLFWLTESPAWPDRAAQIHTQGESETNCYWFACHDFPNDRMTTEIVAAVPQGYLVSANGRLVDWSARPHGTGADKRVLSVFHFLQSEPHVAYLVSLIVGKFDVVDLGTAELPMPVYVPPGRGPDVPATYGQTPEMIDVFASVLDEPYPWDKYAQLLVWNFGAGGMENTSATTVFDTAVIAPDELDDHDLIGLISHELAHQWFGDLLTCNSWEHIWLNEGWATFCESLWYESQGGAEAYLADIQANVDAVIGADLGAAPYAPGMVSEVYDEPDDVFGRDANPYPKGASILHMLRTSLGDRAFFAGVRAYIDRYKYKTVETADFRRSLEDASGEQLERFFDQWCLRPGIPRLVVDTEWNSGDSTLDLRIHQTQVVNGANPAFAFDLPIEVATSAGTSTHHVWVETTDAEASLKLDSEPRMVTVNPDLAVLAEIHVNQPTARWLAQLDGGSTLPARVQAARHLAEADGVQAAQALQRTAMSEDVHDAIRIAAVEALATRRDVDRLIKAAGVKDPEVRRSAIRGLGQAGTESTSKVVPLLVRTFNEDTSSRARGEAVRAMGTLGARDQLATVLSASLSETQHDGLRQAALDAMRSLDAPECLNAAILLTDESHHSRTRANAIGVVAALAHHDRARAYQAIEPLLGDRTARVWQSAGDALVEIGDRRGLDALRALLARHRDDRMRARIQRWIDALEGGSETGQGG